MKSGCGDRNLVALILLTLILYFLSFSFLITFIILLFVISVAAGLIIHA